MMNPSASSIFLVQLVCFLVFLPIGQCSSQTPDYDICLYLLKYNGGSGIYSANRTRLADVMIDVVGFRATDALAKAIELLRKTPQDLSLTICRKQYTYIKLIGVPTVKRDAYMNHQAAKKLMHEIYDRVGEGCEYLFRAGKSPLTEFNLGVQKVAAIAEAIIGQLG
ncbi:hypothetical protein ACLB2K_015725 [Fragaria x ananassa]